MDAWGIDVVLTAAQKCLGTPPGLAILVLSELAMEKRRSLPAVPAYYSDLLRWLPIMHDPSKYFSTPCVNEVRAFAEATRIILEEGLEERFERHALYAEAIRAGLAALGFTFFTDPDFLASTLSVVRYPDGVDDKAFRARLSENGVVVAGGLAETAGQVFRMGHMGNLTSADVRTAIDAVERTLAGLGCKVGPGSGREGRRRHSQSLKGRSDASKSHRLLCARRRPGIRRNPVRENQERLPGDGLQRPARRGRLHRPQDPLRRGRQHRLHQAGLAVPASSGRSARRPRTPF